MSMFDTIPTMYDVQVSSALERSHDPRMLFGMFHKFMSDPAYYEKAFTYLSNPANLDDAEYSDIFKDAMGYRPYMPITRECMSREW